MQVLKDVQEVNPALSHFIQMHTAEEDRSSHLPSQLKSYRISTLRHAGKEN